MTESVGRAEDFAFLAVILQVGLVIIGVSAFWQLIVVGAVLLIAVLLDRVSVVRRSRSVRGP